MQYWMPTILNPSSGCLRRCERKTFGQTLVYVIQSAFQTPVHSTNTQEMERYFYTYVGAAVYCHGSTAVVKWANILFNLLEGIKLEDEEMSMDPPGYPAPPPPVGVAPPVYPSPPGPSGDGGSGNNSFINLLSLSLIHETAAKNKANIEYTQTPTGPPHTPVWTVRCLGM